MLILRWKNAKVNARLRRRHAPDLDPRGAQPVGYQELWEMTFAVN
jgi:hypothetical protein